LSIDLMQEEVAAKVRQAIDTLRVLAAEGREVEIPYYMGEILSEQWLTITVEA
jgi:hypothetical protein